MRAVALYNWHSRTILELRGAPIRGAPLSTLASGRTYFLFIARTAGGFIDTVYILTVYILTTFHPRKCPVENPIVE
jgi:hypothetical protein